MARPTRIDFPGAWYHVFNRGIEKRFIFRSTRCYERFLELLATLPGRFGVRLHGYVLMPNHYHLQVETPEANLRAKAGGVASIGAVAGLDTIIMLL
jgi:putative transposase